VAIRNVIEPDAARPRLAEWWARHRPAARDVVVSDVFIPHSSGMSSETVIFRVRWDEDGRARDTGAVARLIASDGQVFPGYDFGLERRAMDAVRASTTAPVPRVLAIETDPTVLGAPFLVMERRHGRTLADDPPFTAAGWLLELTAPQQATLYDNGLAALAEVHRAEVGGFAPDTLGHPARPGGASPTRQHIEYWQRLYSWGCGGRQHPTIDAAFAWLRAHEPAAAPAAGLLWGDARLGNLLFDDDLAVTAVLDWEVVALGPAEVDLGWFVFINRMYTEGIGVPVPPGFPDRAATVARYEQLAGRAVRDFDYYEVLGGLRVSIIILRIATMMIEKGMLPPDAQMPINNPASAVLATLLDLPAPSAGEGAWITGSR
jgi:aminoglycoside phosphotransferase (APT) family kinase protein